MTYLSTILADSPQAFLRMNEPSGSSFADATGNSHTGTKVGTPVMGTAGIPGDSGGAAVTFDGTGTMEITVATLTSFPTTGSHSFEIWFKEVSGATNGGLVGYGTFGGTNGQSITFRTGASNTVVVDWNSGDLLIGTAGASFDGDGLWHHLVVTYNSGTTTRTIYFDGASIGSDTPTGTPAFVLSAFSIGTVSGNDFNGSLSNAAVYTVALSSGQVSAHYTAGITSIAPNPPTGLTATPNLITGAIDLAWIAPASGPTPDSYTVTRSTSTGTETSYHTGVLTTSYSDLGVTAGVTYYYEILSHTTAGGDSIDSNEASAIAPPTVVRTVQLTDTIVNGALVPQVGIIVTATLSVPGSALPVDSTAREIDLTPLTDVTNSSGTYVIDAASGEGVIAPQDIWQNSGGTLIPLPGCTWTISYLATTIVSPEFAWAGSPIHPSSWVAPFETLGRFKMWLTDINGNGVVRPGVTFGCSLNADTTWTGGAGAGQLISASGQFQITTDNVGNIFLWVIRISEFADAGRYYNLVELSGGSGLAATFLAPDLYTNDQGVYNGGTTYAISKIVRRAVDDVPFISQAGGNVGHALTDPTWWLVYNGEKVTLNTFLVGPAGTQVADTSMIAMADTTDSGNATAYAAPFTLAKQIKHIFYAIRGLLGSETLLSGKAAVILNPSAAQSGIVDVTAVFAETEVATKHIGGFWTSAPPVITAGAGAGTAPTLFPHDSTHVYADLHGANLSVTTGTSPAAGILLVVTLHDVLVDSLRSMSVVVQGTDTASQALVPHAAPHTDGTAWDLVVSGTPAAATSYHFQYVMMGS